MNHLQSHAGCRAAVVRELMAALDSLLLLGGGGQDSAAMDFLLLANHHHESSSLGSAGRSPWPAASLPNRPLTAPIDTW